jgi:hypothetical protein
VRGTWDDLNRRLAGALLGLDLGDVLTVGDRVEPARRGLFSRRVPPSPRRWVSATAAPTELIGECVGSTSFGGEWETGAEVEERLERMGWQRPWSPQWPTWQREHPLQGAPRLALAMVRALQALDCEVADLEVTLTREEPER